MLYTLSYIAGTAGVLPISYEHITRSHNEIGYQACRQRLEVQDLETRMQYCVTVFL